VKNTGVVKRQEENFLYSTRKMRTKAIPGKKERDASFGKRKESNFKLTCWPRNGNMPILAQRGDKNGFCGQEEFLEKSYWAQLEFSLLLCGSQPAAVHRLAIGPDYFRLWP
jgi:hypothetical protein